jgi:hypothetical protein
MSLLCRLDCTEVLQEVWTGFSFQISFIDSPLTKNRLVGGGQTKENVYLTPLF